MAPENTRPFLDEHMSSSSRQSTQIADERDSIDDLDNIDMEKMRRKEGNYILLDTDSLFVERSSVTHGFIKFRKRLSAQKNYIYSAILLLFTAGLFGLSLFGFLKVRGTQLPLGHLPGFEYTSSGELLSCGSNFEEAEAAGCTFDIMTFAWTPPACLDDEVYADVTSDLSELAPSRGAGTWPWWRYENRTEPLEQSSEVLKSYDAPWSNHFYHRAHCLYLWRIMHKAAQRVIVGEKEVYVYSKAAQWEHVVNCNFLLPALAQDFSDYVRTVRVIGPGVSVAGL